MKDSKIKNFLDSDAKKDLLRFSTAGSVDDGKSTLIGRLLHDSKAIYEDTLASLRNASHKTTEDTEIDFAHVTDGLQAEREQGITIDVAYRYFSTPKRKFIIADTPGHEQYTRNMATGASTANLAVILIDARKGVITQSKRHAFISSLLGIPHIVVAVNKMDLVNYSEKQFINIKNDFTEFSARLGIKDLYFIPISALKGDNVVSKSINMPWFNGAPLLEYLETVHIASDINLIDLRFPVQYVLRPSLDFRGYAGQLTSGVIRIGDKIRVIASGNESRVKSIITSDGNKNYAFAPQSITISIEDEIDISRGDMLVHPHNLPHVNRHFEGMIIWMSEEPMKKDREYFVKHVSRLNKAKIDEIRYKVDVNTLHRNSTETLKLNEIGRVVFTCRQAIFYDSYAVNRGTGSFILIDQISNNTVAAGMILDREPAESLPTRITRSEQIRSSIRKKIDSLISQNERTQKLRQKPVTVWITGPVSSGKQLIARQLEKKLFDSGHISVYLDGATVRSGLSSELDFSNSDRAEHLRRVSEICRLLNDAGLIVVASFVSPTISTREQIAEIIGKERFIEIQIDTPLQWRAERDQTGLYEKAKKGEIDDLAGVSFPYEMSENPSLTLYPHKEKFENCANKIIALLKKQKIILAKN